MDLFSIVPIFVGLIFVVVAVGLVVAIVRAIAQWHANNQQPVESVAARVVSKRTHVRGHGATDRGSRATTVYYCTFEDQQGTRQEFHLSGREYGQLAEGDVGMLTRQGTRYHGFERQR